MNLTTFYTRALQRERHIARPVASVASRASQHQTRWCELHLFVTPYGRYLCQVIGRSINQGEAARYSLQRGHSQENIMDVVGYGGLARTLYEKAGFHQFFRITGKRRGPTLPSQPIRAGAVEAPIDQWYSRSAYQQVINARPGLTYRCTFTAR